jgi:hypothetical protein
MWMKLTEVGSHGCVLPRPVGARDLAYEATVLVPRNGFDPGERTRDGTVLIVRGSRKGEDLPCGEISCATASVVIPAGLEPLRIDRYASEANGIPAWYADPYLAIGWCNFEKVLVEPLPSREWRVSVTLKNWSENRDRLLRVVVWVGA